MSAAIFGFIIGVVLGSFIKATADRVILNKSLWGRSYCLHCKKRLQWYDLIPLFSCLVLRGKCRYCHRKIPFGDFLTEIILGLVVGVLFWLRVSPVLNPPFLSELIFQLFIIVILSLIFIIDLKTGLIPDLVTYPASIIALFYLFLSSLWQGAWTPALWAVLSGLGLAGIFTLLIILTQGKGMGWGDVKYVLFLGLALGFPNSLVAVFLAFLTGAVVSLALIVFGKKHFGQTVPFGPFLSLGALISLLFGSQIINWYLGI